MMLLLKSINLEPLFIPTSLMPNLSIFSLLFVLGTFAFSQPIFAQQKYIADTASDKQTERATDFDSKVQKLIGRTFWLKPNLKAIGRVVFYESPSENAINFPFDKEISFVATGYEKTSHFRYLKVEFIDGQVGYLQLNWSNIGNDKIEKPIEFLLDDKTTIFEYADYIYPSPPSEFLKSYWEKRPKERQDSKPKSPPRIGMTEAQVLASSWGKPTSVNTTITAYGNSEQWVYGNRMYVYFRNGKVSAIQY
jgi:hypothetical protein